MKNILKNFLDRLYLKRENFYQQLLKKALSDLEKMVLPLEKDVVIKKKNLPSNIGGEIKSATSKYNIFIAKDIDENELPHTLFHEIGECIAEAYWVNKDELEKLYNIITNKSYKKKVLENGENIIFTYLSQETALPKKFIKELCRLKKKKEISPEKMAKRIRKLTKKYGIPIDITEEFWKRLSNLLGEALIYKRKLYGNEIERIAKYFGRSLPTLRPLTPPLEILSNPNKLVPIIEIGEKLSKELESFVINRNLGPQLASYYNSESDLLQKNIHTLKDYLQKYERVFILSAYREGFCEFYSRFMCKKYNYAFPIKEKKLVLFDQYTVGLKLFEEFKERANLTDEQVIKKALFSRDFEELFQRENLKFNYNLKKLLKPLEILKSFFREKI